MAFSAVNIISLQGSPAFGAEAGVVRDVFKGTVAPTRDLAGFSLVTSILPGQSISFAVKSKASWNCDIVRLGSYARGNGKIFDSAKNQPAKKQPHLIEVPETKMLEAPWESNLTFSETNDWPTGLYVARFKSSAGYTIAPFVVRDSVTSGKSVMKISVMTFALYNGFGGRSSYSGSPKNTFAERSYGVSLDRPLSSAAVGRFQQYIVSVTNVIDQLLPNAAWTTDIDASSHLTDLSGARQIISDAHDEYWSVSERQAVEDAIQSGTNLLLTGANTIYWRVRLEPSTTGDNRHIVVYKDAALDPLPNSPETTVKWRDEPFANSESALTGNQFEWMAASCASGIRNWKITTPNWWGYAGTKVEADQEIPGLIGAEVDQIVSASYIPANTQVIAHRKYTCRLKSTVTAGRSQMNSVQVVHDATYVTTASGSAIFSPGTLYWACAMNTNCKKHAFTKLTNTFVQQVMRNLVTEFDRGPAGNSHPAQNNVRIVTGFETKVSYL